MGKSYETKLNRFDGGVTTVLRGGQSNESRLIKHFDNFTKKNALIPYRNVESCDGGALVQATTHLQNFLLKGSTLYAIGKQTGNNYATIYENDAPNVGTNWAISVGTQPSTYPTVSVSDMGTENPFNFFVEYKGVIYYYDSNGIGSYNIVGETYAVATAVASITSITQGIIHSKDSILYFGYNTATTVNIEKYDGSSWTKSLTINTTDYKVSSVCEYGNYLAIALQSLKYGINSTVLLWDRDSTVNTVSETVDWGNNSLYAIENIDGYLIGISLQTNIGSSAIFTQPKLVIKKYGGGGAVLIKEIVLNSVSLITGKQKFNNRLYFAMQATSLIDSQNGGTTNDLSGVWSVGRSGENEPFSVNFDRAGANSGVITFVSGVGDTPASTNVGGFIVAGDFTYISHLVGSTYTLTKTNYQNAYSAISEWQTQYLATVDSSTTKKLIGVTLTYEKIPSGGSVSLYYRYNGDTTWTLIFTDSTENSVSHEAINIESTGATLAEYEEVEFRVVSQGVAVTGLFFKEETLEKGLY